MQGHGSKAVIFHEVSTNKPFQQYEGIGAPYEQLNKALDPQTQVVELPSESMETEALPTSANRRQVTSIKKRDIGTTRQREDENFRGQKYSPHDTALQPGEAAFQPSVAPVHSPADTPMDHSSSAFVSGPTTLSSSSLATTSTAVTASSPISEDNPSRLDLLRAKREKIRVEKERLTKLQELEEMEAAIHLEIQEEENRRNRVQKGG